MCESDIECDTEHTPVVIESKIEIVGLESDFSPETIAILITLITKKSVHS